MTGAHLVVENVVPFSQVIYAWLCLRSLQLEAVVQHDRVERNYLAWETVRKQTNPFFETGTGFEGYLIGRCPDAAAALDETVDIGQRILDAIRRMYRFEYGFRARLMATLLRERADSALIAIWAEYLGAELGRLRAQVVRNDAARQFQAKTYHIVETLPPMHYRQIDDAIRQRYAVGSDGRPPADRLKVTLTMLKPGQQDAWLVVENIGQFGHPLIRHIVERG